MLSHYKEEMRALQHLMRAESGAARAAARGVARCGARGARGDAGATSSSAEAADGEDSSGSADLRAYPRCRPRPRPARRPYRPHRRIVWRLQGKYQQETTVKMVRWIQEQMSCPNGRNASDSSSGGGGDR